MARAKSIVPNWGRTVDKLTEADFQIFEKAKTNVNYFTDWYCRTDTSGTRWSETDLAGDTNKELVWQVLYQNWLAQNRPEKSLTYKDTTYNLLFNEDKKPTFWLPHGFLWQDWQSEAYHDPRPEQTIIGGFGTGKTIYIAMTLVVLAATIPNFRGYAVAPQMLQAMEVYRAITTLCSNTLWWNRWIWRAIQKPYPLFELQNNFIGQSTIEILSIETNPEKVRTLEGDIIFLDQAEKIEELDDVVRDLGSRLRGTVHGRNRLGKLSLIANAGDNAQLWYRYDMAEHMPDVFMSMNPKSSQNPYLSKRDIESLYRRVGGTAQSAEQWMNGERPMGAGKHFSQATVQSCIDLGLNKIMDQMQERKIELVHKESVPKTDENEYILGFHFVKDREAGVVRWEMPPVPKADYIVIADPGQGNPPGRNSACILVWDITDFPHKPARLRAFHWVRGDASYWPFLLEFERYVKLYKAQGRCAFDSTGVQKGFDELVFTQMGLMAEGMNMSQSGKYLSLNALKMFMGKQLMQFPYIPHMVNQLTKYDLPDTKLAQDIVMAMAMSAAYMRRFYYEDVDVPDTLSELPAGYDRIERQVGRDRYDRNRYDDDYQIDPYQTSNWSRP